MLGELAAAADQARTVTIESRASHDLLSEMTGLMSESITLSFQGDAAGAQLAITAALDGAPEVGDWYESACHPTAVLASLAGGDIQAAWAACERALPTITHPYNAVNAYWVVYAALAAGNSHGASRRRQRHSRDPRLLVGHWSHCAGASQDRVR